MLTELTQVAAIMTGMLLVAALSAMSRYLDSSHEAPLIQITFNEARNRQALDDIITAEPNKLKQHEEMKFSPWEPTSGTLIIEDPALALAKLRIDLERELRRIAFKREVMIDPRRVTIRHLVDTLADRKILEKEVATAIRDVIPACNLAIHGGQITREIAISVLNMREIAISVLNIGQDLLDILRMIESNVGTPAY
jgi:hypothetical protein